MLNLPIAANTDTIICLAHCKNRAFSQRSKVNHASMVKVKKKVNCFEQKKIGRGTVRNVKNIVGQDTCRYVHALNHSPMYCKVVAP